MKTPICDFVKQYALKRDLRLHMPGHKGEARLGAEPLDITEIDGADVLYSSHGIIRESEENAASLFGSGRTLYSCEGSSLAIRAMLYLASLYAREQGKAPRIAAGRNAHKVFMTACALLDIEPCWLRPENDSTLLSCDISARALDSFLRQAGEKPTAVYITSPDYLGNTADIRALAEVCHAHGVLLLVDNAHGAYLNFLPESRHPMALGVDMCCDSAHKTLPVLTGGAYLHIAASAPASFFEQGERAMALFASTSPSYLTLQSLDMANAYIADGYRECLASFAHKAERLKARLRDMGYTTVGSEPLKLTLAPKGYGYTGECLAKALRKSGMECEFSDSDYTVMMLTPQTGEEGLERIYGALAAVPRRTPVNSTPPSLPRPQRAMKIREALLAPSEEVAVESAVGRILADTALSCPPAIPILVSGERIDGAAIDCFKYYGITKCRVVKERP